MPGFFTLPEQFTLDQGALFRFQRRPMGVFFLGCDWLRKSLGIVGKYDICYTFSIDYKNLKDRRPVLQITVERLPELGGVLCWKLA